MNPYYAAAKSKEEPPKKKVHRRKDGDFRDIDDMHTANYYFENGRETHYTIIVFKITNSP